MNGKEMQMEIGAVQSESREMEIEEQDEANPALDELLSVVSLDSPLTVEDHAGNRLSISKQQFIEYYMPKDATKAEKFHCYQAVRASGLSLLIPGECYFFKTGDGPIRLFTGYPAYLRRAYANGLESIEKPEIEFAEDGLPVSCTITLKIKDRPDFAWTTYFDEVAGTVAGGKLNKRWEKAPIFQLIKCSTTNNLRFSGLVDFTLPYTVDEMPDPIAEGFRTLTQEQLSAREDDQGTDDAETSDLAVKEVSATHHQIDLTPLRKSYFATVVPKKEDGEVVSPGLFRDDDQRHRWQLHISGAASASDWGMEDYAEAFRLINSEEAAKWIAEDNKPEPDPPEDAEVIQEPEEPDPEAKGSPQEGQMTEAETAEFFRKESEEGKEITEEQLEAEPEDPEELKQLRVQFLSLCVEKFKTIEERDAWMVINVSPLARDEWNIEIYKRGIERMSELPSISASENAVERLDNEADKAHEVNVQKAVQDLLANPTMNLFSNFLDLGKQKFPTKAERDEWITKNLGKSTLNDPWSREDYARGIVLLRYLPDVQGSAENEQKSTESENKTTDSPEPQSENQDAESGNLAQILTKETHEAVRTLVMLSDKYPMMRSAEFRARAAEIIGHKYGEFKKIREEEGKLILAALQEESVSGIEEPRDDGADPNADKELVPEDVLTNEQKALIEHYVIMMPERFRMGTEVVRGFITATIKKVEPSFRYSAIGKLTEAQATIVIQAQKDFIREEADKFNAANGGT